MGDYSKFDITDAIYKTVDGQGIGLTILTEKELKAGRYPVLIRFHGGFLVTGSRMYPDWFRQWILDFGLKNHAIIITPDYRLMPEASGADILSDIASFYTWIHEELPFKLSPLGLEADLSNILVCGESAGGYLATQSALLHANAGIKAAISMYGVLDIKTRFYTESYEKIMMGSPMVDANILDDHRAELAAGKLPKVVVAAEPPQRLELTRCVIQHGHYVELLGDDKKLYPMDNLEARSDGEIPPMWLFHGRDDTAVPVEGSQAFAEKLKTLHPSTDLLLTIEPGEHGFDSTASATDPWLSNGLEFISKYWP